MGVDEEMTIKLISRDTVEKVIQEAGDMREFVVVIDIVCVKTLVAVFLVGE